MSARLESQSDPIMEAEGVSSIAELEQARALHSAGAVGALGDIAKISEKDLANAVFGVEYIVFTAGAGEQDDDLAIDRVDGVDLT